MTPNKSGDGSAVAALSTSTPDASGVIRTAASLRLAAAAGRDDCRPGWLVVDNAPFSVCIPPDHYAEFVSVPRNAQKWLSVRLVAGAPVAATPSSLSFAMMETYQPPTTCEFEAEQIDTSAQTALTPYTVAGVNGVVCTARTSYAVQLKGSVPLQPQALQFRAYAVTESEFERAKQILATVRPQ